MISIKTKEEIKKMTEGARILASVMEELGKEVRPGITTKELDMAAESHILRLGGKPSFKGYGGFPATLCASVNEQIVHAVPSNRKLKEGDIITLDLGVFYKGFHSDMAKTFPVGEISSEARRLIRVTRKALKAGIKKARPGNTIGGIGNSIQRYIESQQLGNVVDLCGHGIGKDLHEDPQILNYGKRNTGPKIKTGMVFCLEPMVTLGDWRIKKGEDGQCYETQDGSLAAHFEHEILITEEGSKILTKI